MSSPKSKWHWLWWIGVPIAVLLLTWGPHWAWNLAHGDAAWWRIPVIGQMMFDLGAYLEWMGSVTSGIDYGGHMGWFEHVIRLFNDILPKETSVSELWFVTRWISMTVIIWVGAWFFKVGAHLRTRTARILSLLFFVSTWLVLGMRPAVYSWYVPFGFLSIIACIKLNEALNDHQIRKGVLWSVVALVSASVYPWFFIYHGLWALTLWSVWLVKKSRRLFLSLLALGAVLAGAIGFLAPILVHTPAAVAFYEAYKRHGLAFTHLPVITNTLVVLVLWLFLCGWLAIRMRASVAKQRMSIIGIAWIILFFTWMLSAFTGIFIHNDHFRTSVLLLAWLNFALIWSFTGPDDLFSPEQQHAKWTARLLPLIGVMSVSGAFSVMYVFRPFALDGDLLNVLHLSHWLVLFFASLHLLVLSAAPPSVWTKGRTWFIGASAVLMGGVAFFAVYQKEFAVLPDLHALVPVIEWVQNNTTPADAICTDPTEAGLLAPHLKRRTYMTQQSFLLRERTVEAYARLKSYLSAYDANAAKEETIFAYFLNGAPSSACVHFHTFADLFHRFGMSGEQVSRLTGCDTDFLQQNTNLLEQLLNQETVQPDFAETCPVVITSKDTRAHWRLPADYTEQTITPTVSAWVRTTKDLPSPQ